MHISARVAWHDDGWNGHICRNPAGNTFCVGSRSYPGESIAEERDLEWETANAGRPCESVDAMPPCSWSINAFGKKRLRAYADAPDFFASGTPRREWDVPASTVCLWPYEEMYGQELRDGKRYDHAKRLARAREYFAQIEPQRSLVFYYANYSNPFSEDEAPRYVVVGISRVREIGPELFYEGAAEKDKERYGGAFVWSRNVTSAYPDEGLRLPYHRYRRDREALDRFVVVPDNPRLCKYGTRAFSDDDALGLVEQLLAAVRELRAMGDDSEDWRVREDWLHAISGELWRDRGLYPGLPAVLEFLGAAPAIEPLRALPAAKHSTFAEGVFAALEVGRGGKPFGLDEATLKRASRRFRLLDDGARSVAQRILPRLQITRDHVDRIVGENREEHGLPENLDHIAQDPYVLCERFIGDDPDDRITWATVDRAVLPSPDLGGAPLSDVGPDDARRFRALLADALRRNTSDTFVPVDHLISQVNDRLAKLPAWKSHAFSSRYLEVDREVIAASLVQREIEGAKYVYLESAWRDERAIEDYFRFFAGGPDVPLRRPVTEAHWRNWLHRSDSVLAGLEGDDYRTAIDGQIALCQRLFRRPLACIAGAAGTGKTTVVRAIVDAVRLAHGDGSPVLALAPTGKAADRLREVLGTRSGVRTETVHAFLARNGWLRDNMTVRPQGRTPDTSCETVIIDECSMLDLEVLATTLRALDRNAVRRMILVGDPNQLPPIGRGRSFADIVEWLTAEHPDCIETLQQNLRQLEGRATGRGTGIVDLAQAFMGATLAAVKDESSGIATEEMLRRVQLGGDVDADLRVIYYDDPQSLASLLLARIDADLTELWPDGADPPTYKLWQKGFEQGPQAWQILTPTRGEMHGIEALNRECQAHVTSGIRDRAGALDGIKLFDKVIQIRNRTRSRPLYAWDQTQRCVVATEVFNGEIGLASIHSFDSEEWKKRFFRLKRIQVSFARKPHLRVSYGEDTGKTPDGRWAPREKVEDNLELGYAISVHKSQGSEFERTYVVVPGASGSLMSRELFYTALTRARRHCTLFVERDIGPLLSMRRRERSALATIRSSLFTFRAVPDALARMKDWYAEGKVHHTLAGAIVRSKSEVIIANLLFDRQIPFDYEVPAFASDGTFFLPDFTITWRGEKYFWEHLGMLHRAEYRAKWEAKRAWYAKHHPDRLVTTEEGPDLSTQAAALIERHFR